MISDNHTPRARSLVIDLAADGHHHFTSGDARSALGVSAAAAKLALHRLAKRGEVASPARGFYVIVPPEYRRLGCLPAEQFIPGLMEHFQLRYYAGLLTAAQYYGAAHQRPQTFQVVLARNRRPIACGTVRVEFIARKHIGDVPVRSFNTPRGTVLVSSPESTALDLVGYAHHAGGLDHVATVLSELAGQINPQQLVAAAGTAPLPWSQRLGYLLELVGAGDKAVLLKSFVQDNVRNAAVLLASGPRQRDGTRSADWKLHVNTEVEVEI